MMTTFKGLEIVKDLATHVKPSAQNNWLGNGFGYGNPADYITVHQTGNKSKGANEEMHSNHQKNIVNGKSWHITVGAKKAIQNFDFGWQCYHAGDGNGKGNTASIGIEICINQDDDYITQVTNGAKTVAWVMKQKNISINNVKRHFDWSGKNCPEQIIAGQSGIDWNKFKQMVLEFYNDTPVENEERSYDEKGVFYPNETIIVRDQPSTKGKIIARYYKGGKVKYHKVHIKNGYVWLQYNRFNGKQGFIPCREWKGKNKYGKLWGRIE